MSRQSGPSGQRASMISRFSTCPGRRASGGEGLLQGRARDLAGLRPHPTPQSVLGRDRTAFVPGCAKTSVPAGASISSPSSVKVARPRRTTYSSWWPPLSLCSSTTRCPASAVYAFVPNAVIPNLRRTGRQTNSPLLIGSSSSSSMCATS
jgi:hypothetical protein